MNARLPACAFALFLTACQSEPNPPAAAAGAPDPFSEARAALFDELRRPPWNIESEAVLEAMASVRRDEFCLERTRHLAYANRPLPIGHDQTISQPYIVAFMTEILAPEKSDRVLEIGTGSGYQAAVLSSLVDHVYSIEIVEPLGEQAIERFEKLGYDNITVKIGDGYAGWAEHAPFDAIIVTCAPTAIPQPLIDQLADGGRMIIPTGEFGAQELVLVEKGGEEVRQTAVLPVAFVPMTGEAENRR